MAGTAERTPRPKFRRPGRFCPPREPRVKYDARHPLRATLRTLSMHAASLIAPMAAALCAGAAFHDAAAQQPDAAAFVAGQTKDCPGCNLAGVSLKRRNLAGANLAGANLAGASFHRAVLRGANLSGADLTGANLNKTDLIQADLSSAKLANAMLFEAEAS